MSDVLKINAKPCYKSAKPWLQEALSRGRKFTMKTKKRVKVNDRALLRKEIY